MESQGVQFYEGIEGLKNVYKDILDSKQDFRLIRAAFEPEYLKNFSSWLKNIFIKKRLKNNQKVVALTPDEPGAMKDPKIDKEWLLDRTWVNLDDYDTPVEINIYTDKIAILSFSKELIGVIIESKQISQAFKQIFDLARKGASVKRTLD